MRHGFSTFLTSPSSHANARVISTILSKLVLMTLLVACGGGSTTPNPTPNPNPDPTPNTGINQFVNSLAAWDDVSPLEPENNGIPSGQAGDPEEELADGQIYSCTTQSYSITKNPTELVTADPNAGIIWPGALIRGSSHLGGSGLQLLALDKSRRAPLGISVAGGGVLGIRGGVSTEIQEPVASTVREGINQLIANAIESDVAVGSGFSQFKSEESFSAQQATLALGFSARYLGASAAGSLDYSREANEYTYTASFIQRLFTITVDQPESPASFFADSVTASDLEALGISSNNLPLYISSVSYGRILLYSFTSSESREQIEAALEFSYNSPVGGVDGYAEATLEETLRNAKVEVLAIGGPNTGVANLIREGDLAAYFEAPLEINQVEPISFNIRNLKDNSLARVSNTTDFDLVVCEALPGASLPQPVHHWTADGTGEDRVGEVDLDNGRYGAGRFGQSFTFQGDGTGTINTFPVEVLIPRESLFSISAWISPRTAGGVQTIISQLGGSNRVRLGDYAFRVSGNKLQFFIRPADANKVELVSSAADIPVGAWTHVTVVYGIANNEPTAMRLYINGQLDGETVRESNYASTGDAIQLTRVGAAELIVPCDGACKTRFPFNGSIDELMVFDYPLSASEVLTMYQNFDIYKED